MPLTLWDSTSTSDFRGEKVFDWVIFSDLFSYIDPSNPTFLHRSFGSRSFLDISFAPSSLTLSCAWKMLLNLDTDHQFYYCALFSTFPTKRMAPFLQFSESNDFFFHFVSHRPSVEEYFSLSLSSAAILFTSLTLNAAKFSTSFGRVKPYLKPGGFLKWKKR